MSKKSGENSHLFDDEEERGESLFEFVREQVNRLFIENLPFDYIQELPPAYMYYFGTAAYAIAITMFVYFTYYSYEANANQAYISLSQDGGCDSVPISISGDYYADTHGNWVGTPNFEESEALYLITFSNFEITTVDQYAAMMNQFYGALEQLGTYGAHNTLAENLVIWMIFKYYYSVDFPSLTNFDNIGYGQLQTIAMTGDPTDVFNLPYVFSRVGSKAGICSLPSISSQDPANHKLSNSYGNYSMFKHDPVCAAAVNPNTFGYHTLIDNNAFKFELDTMSFATAMGVNLGYLSISNLRIVVDATLNFTYQGVNYTMGEYFNADYSAMGSIYCIHNTSMVPKVTRTGLMLPQYACFLNIGSTLTFPVFNHFGANEFHPEYCSCARGTGHSLECQTFDLMAGLMFFVNTNEANNFMRIQQFLQNINKHNLNVTSILTEFGVFDLMDVLVRYPSYKAFNEASYNASYWVVSQINSAATACGKTCLEKSFSFCSTATAKYCSIFAFNTYDFTTRTVSDYKYQLFNGSCANTFTVSSTAWNSLINNPPVQFTQLYFECYQDDFSAFVGAIGIAVGNTQLMIPFVILSVLPLLYLFLVCIRQVPPKEEYQSREKEEVIEIFTLLLLRLRDGKTRGIKRSGVLMTLAKELIAAAKEEGGYPDSDDEEEEESRPTTTSPLKDKYRESDAHRYNQTQQAKSKFRPTMDPYNNTQNDSTIMDEASMIAHAQHQKNVRLKMSVFTKHLKSGTQNNRGSDASRGSSMDITNTNKARPSSGLFRTARQQNNQPNGNAGSSQFPVLSSMFSFGGKSHTENDIKQQEMYDTSRINSPRMYFFPNDAVPVTIKILNISADYTISLSESQSYQLIKKVTKQGYQSSRQSVKILSENEIDLLIEDLTRIFSEGIAISSKKHMQSTTTGATKPVSTNTAAAASRRILAAESAPDSDDEEEWRKSLQMSFHNNNKADEVTSTENPMTAPPSPAAIQLSVNEEAELATLLQRGQLLSQRFLQVNLQDFLARDDQTIYLRLFNIVIMHASIEMNRPMTQMSSNHAHQVAYVIGNQILTAQDINNIL